MNLTLVGAIVLLAVWMIIVFVAHVGSGPVHLLYLRISGVVYRIAKSAIRNPQSAIPTTLT